MDSKFPQLDALYRDTILDHYRTPRGRKEIDDPDVENEGLNPLCGDEVRISVKFDGDRIEDVAVLGQGCSISIASGSMLAEILKGKSRDEALEIAEAFRNMMHDREPPEDLDLGDLDALEGVKQFPVRVKCALLAWTTLVDAIKAQLEGHRSPESPTTTEP